MDADKAIFSVMEKGIFVADFPEFRHMPVQPDYGSCTSSDLNSGRGSGHWNGGGEGDCEGFGTYSMSDGTSECTGFGDAGDTVFFRGSVSGVGSGKERDGGGNSNFQGRDHQE